MRELSDLLLPWFDENKRDLPWRKDKEPYHVWLSEIMLQQTRVEAVKVYYERFLRALPTVQALADCPEDRLLKLWEGLGYYNRARNLKRAAQVIMEEYQGVFPTSLTQIRALPGIGAYTAGAIASICYDQKTPAVDGNVLRVMARLFCDASAIDLSATKKACHEKLVTLYPDIRCGDFTQSLMELGALVCIPNGAPKCHSCPLAAICQAHSRGCTEQFPVKKGKRKRTHYEKTVFVLYYEDGKDRYYAIQKRTEKGLLHGLYEFYNIEGHYTAHAAMEHLTACSIPATRLDKEIKYTHIFTHVEWHMTAYYVACRECAAPFQWVRASQLTGSYALPTAFRVFLDVRE